ncbi:hypothetical protein Q9R08_01050 [Microbacterium sp. QXD-8]|uniref:Phenol hydroxylase-like C-terminal dimerisation domain-containing protein n=1 Tax=Microbacterium psychrotolerans TaxID=3068321 RepID=A0ABU0YY80_9MICO|nr:hypothetical protein [Microbacterium sp. QXD-8]MDQ7876554.1 hypothetical protein [Microbacterium sp. QXD-8]
MPAPPRHLFADVGRSIFDETCAWLAADPTSPIRRHTPATEDADAVIDVRGIVQHPHRDVQLDDLPALLRPRKGRLGLVDTEKVFSSVTREGDIYAARHVDRLRGAAIIVRPDQHVPHVLPLDDRAGPTDYFAGVLSITAIHRSEPAPAATSVRT